MTTRTFTDAGASGRGAGVGWVGGSAWAVGVAASFAVTSACARRAIAALRRCLQKPWGAFAKSLQSQWPLTMWYVVVPLDWEATRAVPSANTSTSPANTILTALSTRPLHSGNFAWALAAISATAARQAARLWPSGAELSSQGNAVPATIALTFPFDGDG